MTKLVGNKKLVNPLGIYQKKLIKFKFGKNWKRRNRSPKPV